MSEWLKLPDTVATLYNDGNLRIAGTGPYHIDVWSPKCQRGVDVGERESIGAAVSVLNANLNAHFPAAPVSAEFVREVIDG